MQYRSLAQASGDRHSRPRLRLHAAAGHRSRLRPASTRSGPRRSSARPSRAASPISTPPTPITTATSEPFVGRAARRRAPRAGAARHQAADVADEDRGRLRAAARRAAAAPRHRLDRLLPVPRPVGANAGRLVQRLRGLDAFERARADGRIRHIGFSFHGSPGRLHDDRRRLRLGLLPDPVQLHGRGVPGRHGRAAARGRAAGRRVRDGTAARRDAGRERARCGRRRSGRGRPSKTVAGRLGAALGLEPPGGRDGALGDERARSSSTRTSPRPRPRGPVP